MDERTSGVRGIAGVLAVLCCVTGAGVALGGKGGSGGGGGGGGSISTDGVVVFGDGTSTANRGTYAMGPDGSGLLKLTGGIYPMDVTRGQSRVTVVVNGAIGNAADLVAMRADGTSSPVTILTGSAWDARFSLDGTRIAFQRYDDKTVTPWTRSICVADVVRDGAGDVVGVSDTTAVHTTGSLIRGLDFSRDGSKIVYSLSDDLWTVRISDGATTRLTTTAEQEKYPRWSPVDDRITYTRYVTEGSAVADLMTIDASTGATRTVVAGNTNFYASEYACWSPDGANLLFLARKKNVGMDLYQIPSATSGSAVSVTSGTGIQENTPAWGW